VVAHVGYRDGRHAPGVKDPAQAVAANHHLLLAHGRAVAALRASSASDVGITLNLTVERPVTPEAAGHAAELEARQNGVYLDPIFHGRYPELLDGDASYSPAAVPGLVQDGDLGVIGAPLDFLGVNFYSPHYVGVLRPDGEPRRGETVTGPRTVSVQPDGLPVTAMNWLVEPGSIRELLTRVVAPAAGGRPVYITENGSSWYDYVTADGRIHDRERIEYLRGHLAAIHEAIADGVPVKGYFAWSLLDNYEWAEGYAKRFGLAYVDFATQQRILKDSGEFYASVIAANAVSA
jgi:beta-glucosidase